MILGKYLASLVFLLFLLALTSYYVVLVAGVCVAGPRDRSTPVTSGLVLYGMAALAVGILTSTLTSNQIIAAVVGTGILVVLYATSHSSARWSPGVWATDVHPTRVSPATSTTSIGGIIDSTHVVYFRDGDGALFLFLSIRALESRRWR